MLFNIIIDKTSEDSRGMPGYKLGNENINIVLYIDDAVLIAKSEIKLQIMLHMYIYKLIPLANRYNMVSKVKN